MRNLCEPEIAKWRDFEADRLFGTADSDKPHAGAFLIMRIHQFERVALRVIASNGEAWDHVSVSLSNRTPVWDEMEHIKRLFFKPDETAMQLHVPPSSHVNNHPFCLHLWRPHAGAIPRPPAKLVGIQGLERTKAGAPSLPFGGTP